MGADSSGGNDDRIHVLTNPKIFRNGQFLFTGQGNFRLIDLLTHVFEPPTYHPAEENIDRYMRTKFIDSLMACFDATGYTELEDGVKKFDGSFMVAYLDRLFEVQCDFAVLSLPQWGFAGGSGIHIALGSLHTTYKIETNPVLRLLHALESAAEITPTVCGPFSFMRSDSEEVFTADRLSDAFKQEEQEYLLAKPTTKPKRKR
jgi:hypothetical protein